MDSLFNILSVLTTISIEVIMLLAGINPSLKNVLPSLVVSFPFFFLTFKSNKP